MCIFRKKNEHWIAKNACLSVNIKKRVFGQDLLHRIYREKKIV